MSVEELKAVVDNASDAERLVLAAYIRARTSGGAGPLGVALAEASARMQAGQSVSLEKALEAHQQLEKLGL